MPPKKKSVSSSSLIKVTEKSTSRSRSNSRGRSLGNDKSKKAKASPSPAKKATPKKRTSRSPARKQSTERKQSPLKKVSPSPKKKSTSPENRVSRRDTVESKGDTGRQSSRLVEKEERIVEKQNDTRTTTTRTETISSSTTSTSSAKRSYIYGGPIGSFFHIILLPIVAFYLHELVRSPSTIRIVKPDYKNWRYYLNIRTMGICLAWILVHALFSVFPIGKKVSGLPNRRIVSRYNGFPALILSLGAVLLGHYLKCTCLYYVLEHLRPMVVTSIIFSFVISTALYIKGSKASKSTANPEANTGCTPYDYFIGRELHPRLFGIMDLKLFFVRPGLIGWAVLDLMIILKSYDNTKQVNLVLAFMGACHLLYISDGLFYEETFSTTFENNREGFGYMAVMGVLCYIPFIYSISMIFAFENLSPLKVSNPTSILVSYGLLFLSGYFIYRASNSQKHLFKTDPHHPSLSNLHKIYTSGNKSLLAGGWWGFVRHPNYLGDILMSFAMCLPAGLTSAIPWIYPIFLIHFLISRIIRSESECEKKYGPAWKTYTERDSCPSDCQCSSHLAQNSAAQTLEELDFDRGLWQAALTGNEARVQELRKRSKYDPNQRDNYGYTSLHYAARSGHLSICRLLLSDGADPNAKTKSTEVTPLHRAAYCGHVDVVRCLIEAGAECLSQDADGETCLHKAINNKQSSVAKWLLAHYPQLADIPDRKGDIPNPVERTL